MVSTRRRKSSDRRGSNVSSRDPRAARDKKKEALAPEEMEDAIEAHYRSRARALDGSDASDTSDASNASDPSESSDEEVLGLGGGAAGGAAGDSDEDDASSSDLDSEEEIERNTRYGQLLKQAKLIKAKLDIERGEGTDSDSGSSEPSSEEEEGDGLDAAWGSRKGSYYNADNVDMEGSEEEEDLEAEEQEATRLQKEQMARLAEDDYGSLSEDEDADADDDDDGEGIGHVDDALDDEARDLRASAVRQDALELKALLQELRASLSEIRGRLGPLLQEVKSGEIATAEGVSYLEAKHLLLMHYVAHLVFYLLLKAEGKSVKDHPVIARLIEIRSYLEKTRPIDKKLKYQIEKLLLAADATRDGAVPAGDAGVMHPINEDMASAKPRPGALMVDEDDGDVELDGAVLNGVNPESGTYRPPRLNPVSMELDETDDLGPGRISGKDRRKQLNASRKASRSQYIQEFAAELAGAPEERKMGMPIGMDTADALRQRQKLAARAEVEEELMIRVPLSKDERKKLKAQRRAGLSGKALLDDFQDDLADLVNGGDDLGVDARFSKHKTNQLYGADLSLQASKKRGASGDADIPERASLTARRANMDGIRAKQQRRAISYNMGDDAVAPPPTETDFYRSSKKASESRKQQKRDANAPDALLPPMADPTGTGARRIGNAIEKNRGLTPHRRKDLKNPRKKHRIKFAEAKVRRSGQVQKVVDGAAGAYEGERTGIKSRVSKSVKF